MSILVMFRYMADKFSNCFLVNWTCWLDVTKTGVISGGIDLTRSFHQVSQFAAVKLNTLTV